MSEQKQYQYGDKVIYRTNTGDERTDWQFSGLANVIEDKGGPMIKIHMPHSGISMAVPRTAIIDPEAA